MTRRVGVLPQETASRGAPGHARFLIAEATAAFRRLDKRRASEALHDFRVNLRRLRTWLDAFDEIGGVSVKTRRRLKKLARCTNRGRDAEVQRDWLAAHRSRFIGIDAATLAWLRALAKESARDTRDDVRRRLATRWPKLAGRLQRQLARKGRNRTDEACGPIVAQRVRQQANRLRQYLTRVRSARDCAPAHRARITIKRLRYLLEPFQPANEILRATVAQLVILQDLLGEWQDRVVLTRTLADAAAQAAARRTRTWFLSAVSDGGGAVAEEVTPVSSVAPSGLLRLARMADAEQHQLYVTLHDRHLNRGVAPLTDQLRDCARVLAGAKSPAEPRKPAGPRRRGPRPGRAAVALLSGYDRNSGRGHPVERHGSSTRPRGRSR